MICGQPPMPDGTPELALYLPRRWPRGHGPLRVRWLDGDASLHRRIEAIEAGPEGWSSASALGFVFVDDADVEIQATFQPGPSWSYVGEYPQLSGRPTMNLALLPSASDDDVRRVWLHEAGHALGFEHEHATAAAVAAIPWDFDEVQRWCLENGVAYEQWQLQWVRWPLGTDVVDHVYVDEESIMFYYVPARWVKDRRARGARNRLSPGDRGRVRDLYGAASGWTELRFPFAANN